MARELRVAQPMVDLRVCRERNFSTGAVAIAALSWVLLATGAMLPRFLRMLMGSTRS